MALHKSTESGLYVPEDLARKRSVWAEEDFKRLKRLHKWAEEEELNVAFVCKVCGKVTEWRMGPGGVEVVCDCKVRVVV